ncbi:MAG: hypothetical protein LBE04_06180, partial [Prevotellaceae bacterium]|nr:hypothetical protein [Prevotellaceae bacterium]
NNVGNTVMFNFIFNNQHVVLFDILKLRQCNLRQVRSSEILLSAFIHKTNECIQSKSFAQFPDKSGVLSGFTPIKIK